MSLIKKMCEPGKRYFVRTARYDYVGVCWVVNDDWIGLRQATWITNNGHWHDVLNSGKLRKHGQFETTQTVFLNVRGVTEIFPWGKVKSGHFEEFPLPGQSFVEDFANILEDDQTETDSRPATPFAAFSDSKVFIRTMRYDYIGAVVETEGDSGFKLRNAYWSADTGDFNSVIQNGTIGEGQAYPEDLEILITDSGILEVFEWRHPIPK